MKRIITEILKYLLLSIFAGYIGVISFYTHVHIENGVTVVHSHPFHKNTDGKPFHSHTQLEFQLIKLLTSYSVTADVVSHFQWSPAFFVLTYGEGKPMPALHVMPLTGNRSGRAPPCFTFLF